MRTVMQSCGNITTDKGNIMVVFQNAGLIDVRTINTFGVCVKETENPIGYFGTGMKYALAVLLREGLSVSMYHGMNKFTFGVGQRDIRGTSFGMITINDLELPFTTGLGRDWVLWQAYRELASNTMDEDGTIEDGGEPKEGYTTFFVEGKAFDKIHANNDIFLSTEPLHVFEGVEFHEAPLHGDCWIYYKGIRVYQLHRLALFNYNLLGKVQLTEDRTLAQAYTAQRAIANAIGSCTSPQLIRQVLEANQKYYESTIDYTWASLKAGKTFNDVIEHYGYTGVSYNSSAGRYSGVSRSEAPATIMRETLSVEARRKLWAACKFWAKLGFEIDHKEIRVTNDKKVEDGKAYYGTIYIAQRVLDEDMRYIAGVIYRQYIAIKHKSRNKIEAELLVDTIVEMGERILGLDRKTDAALARAH